jgi:hypothetical protein
MASPKCNRYQTAISHLPADQPHSLASNLLRYVLASITPVGEQGGAECGGLLRHGHTADYNGISGIIEVGAHKPLLHRIEAVGVAPGRCGSPL